MQGEMEELKREMKEIRAIASERTPHSKFKQWSYTQTPEYLLTLAVFLAFFGLMLAACLFKIFGLGIFSADCTATALPALWVQEAIKFTLFWFEYCFIVKILCSRPWAECLLLSFACSVIYATLCFLNKGLAENFTVLYAIALPLLYLKHRSDKNRGRPHQGNPKVCSGGAVFAKRAYNNEKHIQHGKKSGIQQV